MLGSFPLVNEYFALMVYEVQAFFLLRAHSAYQLELDEPLDLAHGQFVSWETGNPYGMKPE